MPAIFKVLTGLAGSAVALALVSAAVPAAAQSATEEINRIINELAPAGGAAIARPDYRQRVKRVTVRVRPDIAGETAYRQNSIIEERTYVLNYNHTEDFTVHFAFDSFALTPKAREVLDVVGAALTHPQLSGEVYLVGGHTDTAGPADYNQWLSEKRAWTVTSYLVEAWGVAPDRLRPVGFGETVLADARRGANVLNRRVEFTLVETRPELAPTARAVPAPTARPTTAALPAARPSDPRPPRHDLDDFGSPRTPVGGEPRATPPATASGSAIDQTNAAIGN